MSNTSSGRKYHPCPTPPTKARRVFTFTMSLAEIIFWLFVALIVCAVVSNWLGA